MNTNFGNFSFGAIDLLTSDEKTAARGHIESFFKADPTELRLRANGQEVMGRPEVAVSLRAAADRLEAGMVPAHMQAKAADEAAQAVSYLEAKPRAKEVVEHWNRLIARAEKVTSAPTFFA